jgi:serine/threonine-protein kinase
MNKTVDARVESLIREERLREAAALCHAQGDVARAVDLLERAAAFEEAARVAVEHGMGARALRLAASIGPDDLLLQASRRMEEPEARALGFELLGRGQGRAAAYAFRAAGMGVEEGEAWERAGEHLEAALAFRRGGEDLKAARALEVRLQQAPGDGRAALELGRLLLAHGKLERAVRALQRVPYDSPEGPGARALLARAFERLGLREARASLGEVQDADAEEVPKGGGEGLLFGRYRVLRQVATTPTARVFCCEDRLTNQKVAVKVLRAGGGGLEGRDAVARFSREAQALAMLRHPKIVPLLAFFPEGPAVVTPWMAGGSLADVLATTALAPDRAAEVAQAVLGALGDAHRLGILHRDLKPSNVLLDGAGAPYLADFGAAHVSDASSTMTAGLIGSMAYLAPELWSGGKATVRSDLYGAGAIFYEALTGERPAPAEEIERWPSTLYDELGAAHDGVFRRLLARDPAGRPATAEEAIELLRGLSFRVTAPVRGLTVREESTPARRLVPLDEGGAFDAVLRRRVRLVPAEGEALRLAQAWARLDDAALATIFRCERGVLWVEDLVGVPLAMALRPLTGAEREAIGAALRGLHRSGVAHGSVDGEHLRIDEERGVALAFPLRLETSASPEGDLAALEALGGAIAQGDA